MFYQIVLPENPKGYLKLITLRTKHTHSLSYAKHSLLLSHSMNTTSTATPEPAALLVNSSTNKAVSETTSK